MTSAPVLALPNSVDRFILDTDASGTAIGAELLQVQDKQERVIAYGSLSLSPEQRRYCVTRLNCSLLLDSRVSTAITSLENRLRYEQTMVVSHGY